MSDAAHAHNDGRRRSMDQQLSRGRFLQFAATLGTAALTACLPAEPTIVPETPEPTIAPATCPDNRLAIYSPGINQTVSGVVPIIGRAVHENFSFYILEIAPGANVSQGFTRFDGSDRTEESGTKGPPVESGTLGNFDSTGVANGTYTIRLKVYDTNSNYPSPCQVTVKVQN